MTAVYPVTGYLFAKDVSQDCLMAIFVSPTCDKVLIARLRWSSSELEERFKIPQMGDVAVGLRCDREITSINLRAHVRSTFELRRNHPCCKTHCLAT